MRNEEVERTENLQFRWTNFRGYVDTGWITLRPLTVIIGPNNAGKSALLQPLWLMQQTLNEDRPDLPLVTRGTIVDAGDFPDVIHNHDLQRSMTLALRFHRHPRQIRNQKLERPGTYPPGEIESTISFNRKSKKPYLDRYVVRDMYGRLVLDRKHQATGRYTLSLVKGPHHSPSPSSVSPFGRQLMREILNAPPSGFMFEGQELWSRLWESVSHPERRLDGMSNWPVSSPMRAMNYLSVNDFANANVSAELTKTLLHIGPLRTLPRRNYPATQHSIDSIGIDGEYSPHVLAQALSSKEHRARLARWLKILELPTLVAKGQPEFATFMLKGMLRDNRIFVNFADLGTGVSQLLPILAALLTAGNEHTIVAEQPEIHLNPRQQASLADVLVDSVSLGRKVVVETHSEHLLTRIRTLVAAGQIAPGQINILFVESTSNGSNVAPMEIDSDGDLVGHSWPDGFFDEHYRLAMELFEARTN